MTISLFSKTVATTAAAFTLAAGLSVASVGEAEAGKKHFWAGVGAGIVTGIVVNEVVRQRRDRHYHEPQGYYDASGSSWDAHVNWCYDRYNSYSHVDDRYTTFSGKRRPCRSPYL